MINKIGDMDAKGISDECDKCLNDMIGSVRAYDRHVIVCFPLSSSDDKPVSWLGSVEDIPAIGCLAKEIDRSSSNSFNVRLTACDYNKAVDNEELVDQVEYNNNTSIRSIPIMLLSIQAIGSTLP